MSISMYQATVPNFVRMLTNLRDILVKASGFAQGKKIDHQVLANYRLSPDMLPLSSQVQIACDTAKGCAARLAGIEAPVYEDSEKTLAELVQRVDKTLSFLQGISAIQLDGSEEKAVVLEFPSITLRFKGQDYVNKFAMPNFYFHVTTTYAILRHCGVELGKGDYLGNIN